MSTNLPEQPQKQNILVKKKEDMNPGFDPGQPYHDPEALLAPQRRHKRAVIESDPEDDIEVQKYSSNRTENSTPSYSMDTDISTLEAPTFTTLSSQGPSQINSLIWDHPVNLIGKKVVNPILHMCDRCVKPILIYGRLGCKHVLCLSCATALKNTNGQCTRCSSRVSQVEQASFGQIWMCSHGGSRYGQDGCQRTYLSERDLKAHVNFRHLKNQPKKVPSAEEIAAATAALMAVDRKMRVPPPSTQAGQVNVPVSAGLPNFSQPPPVINRTPTNLITVPIQDNNTSGSTGSSGAPPPASDYWTTNKFNQPPPSYYQRPPPNHYQSSQQQSSYEWTGSRTGSSGYHRR